MLRHLAHALVVRSFTNSFGDSFTTLRNRMHLLVQVLFPLNNVLNLRGVYGYTILPLLSTMRPATPPELVVCIKSGFAQTLTGVAAILITTASSFKMTPTALGFEVFMPPVCISFSPSDIKGFITRVHWLVGLCRSVTSRMTTPGCGLSNQFGITAGKRSGLLLICTVLYGWHILSECLANTFYLFVSISHTH